MTTLTGMNRTAGSVATGDDHLIQSVGDILTTPLGSRVMRRDYGCMLFDLMDRPLNRGTILLCCMAVALALTRWEPRIEVQSVAIDGDLAAGQARINLTALRTGSAANELIRLSIPLTR